MMLFSFKNLFPTVTAFIFLQCVIALPVFPDGSSDGVVRRGLNEQALLERRLTYVNLSERDALDIDISLSERADSDVLNDIDAAGGSQRYRPGETRLKLGDGARQELDRLNLHGKQRKNVIKWHKKQVQKHMRGNADLKGAHTGVIEHLAHKGGSQPKEKNHITASFKDVNNEQIYNKFNGGRDHHLYVNSKNQGAGRHAKGGLNKNNNRIKGKSTNNKPTSTNRHSKGSKKNGGKGKGKQRQGGATKQKHQNLQPKKGGKK